MGKFDTVKKLMKLVPDEAAQKLLRQDPAKYSEYLKMLDEAYGSKNVRAKNMGFNMDQKYYHGTGNDFSEFDPEKLGSVTGKGPTKEQHWFSSNPEVSDVFADQAAYLNKDREIKLITDPLRHEYSKLLDEIKAASGAPRPQGMFEIGDMGIDRMIDLGDISDDLGKRIKQWKIKKNNAPSEHNISRVSEGANVMPVHLRKDDIPAIDAKGGYWEDYYKDIGNKEIELKNIHEDRPGGGMPMGDSVGITDPSRVRSTHAAFDPRFKNSKNILAGAAGTAIAGTLLGSNQAEAMEPGKYNQNDSVVREAEQKMAEREKLDPGYQTQQPYSKSPLSFIKDGLVGGAELYDNQVANRARAAALAALRGENPITAAIDNKKTEGKEVFKNVREKATDVGMFPQLDNAPGGEERTKKYNEQLDNIGGIAADIAVDPMNIPATKLLKIKSMMTGGADAAKGIENVYRGAELTQDSANALEGALKVGSGGTVGKVARDVKPVESVRSPMKTYTPSEIEHMGSAVSPESLEQARMETNKLSDTLGYWHPDTVKSQQNFNRMLDLMSRSKK
jgi:hypothetical protein